MRLITRDYGIKCIDSHIQRVPGTRVEHAPNSEYAPINELRLITCDYGINLQLQFSV